MSIHTSTASDGYARHNWWGDDDSDDEPADLTTATGCPGYEEDLAQWKAHHYLKQSADLISPIALHAAPDRGWEPHLSAEGIEDAPGHDPTALHQENHEVPMREPEVYVPKRHEGTFGSFDYRQRRYQSRSDDTYGYVSGPLIADQPTEQFLDAVRYWLALRAYRRGERPEDLDEYELVLRDAERLKRKGTMRDVDILATLIEDVRGDYYEDKI